MNMKKYAIIALSLALSAGSAMTSLASPRWVNKNGEVKYQWDEGSYAQNCWIQYKNHWYYVGNDANKRTGWLYLNDHWYFLTNTGEMLTGLIKVK